MILHILIVMVAGGSSGTSNRSSRISLRKTASSKPTSVAVGSASLILNAAALRHWPTRSVVNV